jgi:hypothetical protein
MIAVFRAKTQCDFTLAGKTPILDDGRHGQRQACPKYRATNDHDRRAGNDNDRRRSIL